MSNNIDINQLYDVVEMSATLASSTILPVLLPDQSSYAGDCTRPQSASHHPIVVMNVQMVDVYSPWAMSCHIEHVLGSPYCQRLITPE